MVAVLYIIINTHSFQNYAKSVIVSELENKLDTDLGIKKLKFSDLKTLELDSLYIKDRNGDDILQAQKISTSIDLFKLFKGKIIFTEALLSDFSINISKNDPNSDLNIQFIIDAFASKNDKSNNNIQIQLNSINVINGKLNYNVNDRPFDNSKFDKNHIQINDFIGKFSIKSIAKDSLNIQVKRLSFKDNKGFILSNFRGRLTSQEKTFRILDFDLQLPESKLEFQKLNFTIPEKTKINDSIYKTKNLDFDFVLSDSYITPSDLKSFVPNLKNINEKVILKLSLEGNDETLSMPKLSIDIKNKLFFTAKSKLSNWNEDNIKVFFEIEKLNFTGKELSNTINLLTDSKTTLPSFVDSINNINFNGEIEGYLNNLKTIGNLSTNDGNIDINLVIGFDKFNKLFTFFKGDIKTYKYNIGNTLKNKDFEYISLNINTDIINKNNIIEGGINGIISDFDFKNYQYDDINFEIHKSKEEINLNLKSNDEYANIDLTAYLNLENRKLPKTKLDLSINNFNFSKTNFDTKNKSSQIRGDLNIDIIGNNPNNIRGVILANSFEYEKNNKIISFENIEIKAEDIDSENSIIDIKSNQFFGFLKGHYNFNYLVDGLKNILKDYLPDLPIYSNKRKIEKNAFSFNFTINDTREISNAFSLPFTIQEPLNIKGDINTEIKTTNLSIDIGSLRSGNNHFRNTKINIKTIPDSLITSINSKIIVKNRVTNIVNLHASAANNEINTILDFENDHLNKIASQLKINTNFSYNKKNKELLTDIIIDKSKALLNNQDWIIEKSLINIYGDKELSIKGFDIHSDSNDQSIDINGSISLKNPDENLKVNLKNIDLQYLFETLAIDALQFGGLASGIVDLKFINSKPFFTTNLEVEDFTFNKAHLGYLELNSHLDQESMSIKLDGIINNRFNEKTYISGFIDPLNESLSVDIDATDVDLSLALKYTNSILSSLTGRGTGKIKIFGNFSKVTLEGYADVDNANLGISMLGTNYTFSDKIIFEPSKIYFENIKFYDEKGNIAIGKGEVIHDYFNDMSYDLKFSADNFLIYNATEKLNPIFYGKVFGSGDAQITGDENEVNISANLITQKNTNVFMNFLNNEVSNYSFVYFKEKPIDRDEDNIIEDIIIKKISPPREMSINMNVHIDVTHDASFGLLMDPEGGDMIKGTGSGNLQFIWNSKKQPELYGTFDIFNGSYNFTFQKLMEKKFYIKEGSTVQFRGDPFKALLDVEAYYKVTASLSDLDNTLVKTTGISSIPTNCLLDISGELQHPEIKLDIEFPNSSEDVNNRIKSFMDTEDMINKQVTYLLLLNKFYTPDNSEVDKPSSDWSIMASATLSSQLTKIINQVDERFQLGTHIRMSDAELTRTEAELILSSQLLDNRLLINGNFGYRDDPLLYSNAIISDIDIEYLLNKQGTWRLKAYNHFNERFYYLNSDKGIQTQGIGIIFRKNFNRFSELFNFRNYKRKEKNDEENNEDTENKER